MKKNSIARGSQIRSNKKYNTSVNPTSGLLSSAKQRKSINEEIASPKKRKTMQNFMVKNSLKKNSVINAEKRNSVAPKSAKTEKKKSVVGSKKNILVPQTEKKKSIAGTKKNSLLINSEKKNSIFNKDNNLPKKSLKASSSLFNDNTVSNKSTKRSKKSIKSTKSAKKSIELSRKSNSNQNADDKDNMMSSETSNKNANNEINTIQSENNSNESNSEENSKIKSKSNQDKEKSVQSKSQSKKSSIKPERVSININNHNGLNNNKIPNEYFDNKPENVNLIKEINDKPNYRYEFKYDVNYNPNSQEKDGRLRNYKVESSDYITDKNKNMMRNLLHLLERKPDDKKGTKNMFRTSLNNLVNQENNKLLESLTRTKNEIFRIVQDEKSNYINSAKANSKLYDIYKTLFEQKYNLKQSYENSWNNRQSPYLIREKYFFDYVDNRHPNMDLFLGNNSSNQNQNNRLSNSYDKSYRVMGKNNLKVEQRNSGCSNCGYDSMINSINIRLNKDYREIYRKRKLENLMENINNNIYAMNPMEYFNRKTFSESKRNSLYF